MNRRSLLVTTFLAFSFVQSAQGQEWTRDDFNVSFLKLNAPFDSVSIHLGRPDTVERDDVYRNYFAHYYPKLVVWRNGLSNRVWGFDIQDSSFVTRRGVRIGDSLSKIQRLYGNGGYVDSLFSIAGPSDQSFHDFSKVIIYRRGDFHIAFFIRDQTLVKMQGYIGLVLSNEDWTLGFLKLNASFDSVTVHLWKPDSTTEGDYGSTGFYYPKLVLWWRNETNTLFAMDIYDSTFVTHRGLRFGDYVGKMDSLYYDRLDADKIFRRLGPYDASFTDYSEAITFEHDPNFFIVFTKGEKVVKLLLYVGVND